jgi:Tfp pilus assembly protein PilF
MTRSTSRLAIAILLFCAGTIPAAIAQSPEAEMFFSAGLTHLRENRPQLALEEFKKAVKGDGKSPYFQKGLGVAYMQLGKYDEAVSAFRKALSLNPYYVDVRNDLGTALVLSGKRSEAKAEFVSAYNDPTNPSPDLSARNLGQAYLEEKNYTEAANWFRSSLNKNKSLIDAQTGLAEALLGLQRPDEAIPVLEGALKDAPGELTVLLGLGDAYYRAGRFTEARARLDEVVKKDPTGVSGRRANEMLKHFPR